MLPPPLPCLPSALCPSPSSAKMLDKNISSSSSPSFPSSSSPSPPFWPIPQLPPRDKEILRVEIRCSCHIDLLDAQFAISHNEQTNDFFVELLPPDGRLSAPILCILFRFLPSQPEHLQIFSSSYGHWHRCGQVQHCPTILDEPIRLHVHVHECFYLVELNGKEVIRVKHKREFRRLEDEVEGGPGQKVAMLEKAAICCGCLFRQKQVQHESGGETATIMAAVAN